VLSCYNNVSLHCNLIDRLHCDGCVVNLDTVLGLPSVAFVEVVKTRIWRVGQAARHERENDASMRLSKRKDEKIGGPEFRFLQQFHIGCRVIASAKLGRCALKVGEAIGARASWSDRSKMLFQK
jgi:hypothetical protein